MEHFASKIKSFFAIKLLNLISLFIVNMSLSHFLNAGSFGTFQYQISIASFFIILCSISFEAAIIYFSSNEQNDIMDLLKKCWIIILISFILTIFIYNIFFDFSKQQIIHFVIFIVSNLIIVFYQTALLVKNKQIISLFIGTIINITIIVSILYFGNQTIDNISFYFYSFALYAFLLVAYFHYNYGFKITFSKITDNKKIIAYLSIIFLCNIFFFLVNRIDYWMLEKFHPTENQMLGNYIQASKMGQLTLLVPTIISPLIFSQTAKKDNSFKPHFIIYFAQLLKPVFIIGTIIVVIFGKQIFTLLFGNSFNTAHYYFQILSPGIFFLCVANFISSYFSGINKSKYTLQATFIALIFCILLNSILIPIFKATGAAITSSLVYSLIAFILIYRFNQLNGNHWLAFLAPWKIKWNLKKMLLS